MTVVTIPQKTTKDKELIAVPRKEYEAFVAFRKFKEFRPTVAQKKALARAEANLRKGKTLSYHELAKKLESAR